jgi:hypothetical protein
MASSSSRYHVASIVCTEAELPLVQQTLQTFSAVQGAVTYDAGKARYCLSLDGLDSTQAKLTIEQVRNTVELVLTQLRNGK